MDHQRFARIALSGLCGAQGVAQIAIDLNRTHASNPHWTGHARFHVVWQSVTIALLSMVTLLLLWSDQEAPQFGFYLASALTCLSPLGFTAALLTRGTYGGTLNDPSGIPPATITIRRRTHRIDLNLCAMLLAFAAVIIIVAIFKR